MDSTGSVAAVESALDRLRQRRAELDELWAARKLRLDLCLRLRIFERDALEVITKHAFKKKNLLIFVRFGNFPHLSAIIYRHPWRADKLNLKKNWCKCVHFSLIGIFCHNNIVLFNDIATIFYFIKL